MSWRKYTDEQVREAVATSQTLADVLRKLDLVPKGGNYNTIQKRILRLGIDYSHFTGQGWSHGLELKDIEDCKSKAAIKKRLIKSRGHRCESCQRTEWLERPIPLELHHRDGNRFKNVESNLELLCPNCHAQTDTWKNRKVCAGVVQLADTSDSKSDS